MTNLPSTVNGKCHECGSPDMLLCEETLQYTDCTWVGDEWVRGSPRMEGSAADEAIRLMCTDCGEYQAVPEGLP